MSLNNERFIRWQSHTISQMSLVLGLFATLSMAGLGYGFSLIQHESFTLTGIYIWVFIIALLLFFVGAVSAVVATLTRLLDFRLTAQKVRGTETEEPLTQFGTDASGYGAATWRLLWCSSLSLLLAFSLLAIVCANVYLGTLFEGS